MLLSGADIRRRLFDRSGKPEDWLVISPLLDRESQLKDSNASIDLRLASVFIVPKRSHLPNLDPLHESYGTSQHNPTDRVVIPIGDKFVLHPRQFALAQTIEWVHMPRDLGGYVVGRSRWGRDGLIVATATGVHPRFSAPLTLELTNLGEVPILLYPGLSYVQLFLHTVESDGPQDTAPAAFSGTTEPTTAKLALEEREIIRRWPKN
jgi:dCTP deaminase